MATQIERTESKKPERFVKNGIMYPAFPFIGQTLDEIENGNAPDFDALVAAYPRSGSARLVEIVWLLLHDCDIEKARVVDITDRHVFLEMRLSKEGEFINEPPLVAKTHVNFQMAEKLVEKKKNVIVGLRNPKDTFVSIYHFRRMSVRSGLYQGTWHEFFEDYRKGDAAYGDYFSHTLSWWEQRHRDNILIVRYEDLNEDPLNVITKISAHLGRTYSQQQLRNVAEWTTFSKMKENPSTNFASDKYKKLHRSDISSYMRKGRVGDWKNYFNEEEDEYINNLYDKLCKPVGLEFKFE